MPDLQRQSAVAADEIGEARRKLERMCSQMCLSCRTLVSEVQLDMARAHVRAQGVAVREAIEEFEGKHPLNTPLNPHLRRQVQDYHRLAQSVPMPPAQAPPEAIEKGRLISFDPSTRKRRKSG